MMAGSTGRFTTGRIYDCIRIRSPRRSCSFLLTSGRSPYMPVFRRSDVAAFQRSLTVGIELRRHRCTWAIPNRCRVKIAVEIPGCPSPPQVQRTVPEASVLPSAKHRNHRPRKRGANPAALSIVKCCLAPTLAARSDPDSRQQPAQHAVPHRHRQDAGDQGNRRDPDAHDSWQHFPTPIQLGQVAVRLLDAPVALGGVSAVGSPSSRVAGVGDLDGPPFRGLSSFSMSCESWA